MPYLSPPTLTKAEQQALLEASSVHPRDHLIFSLALGTGLRLSEIIGLDVGDIYFQEGRPRARVRLRREIAKGGRVGDVFLPDALLAKLNAVLGVQAAVRRVRRTERSPPLQPGRPAALEAPAPDHLQALAAGSGLRSALPGSFAAPYRGHERVACQPRPLPRPEIRTARVAADDYDLHACLG